MSKIQNELKSWVSKQLNTTVKLDAIQGDASFRHYYRVLTPEKSYMAVYAPPDKEDNLSFITTTHLLSAQGVPVPTIFGVEASQGFMLIADFGDALLLNQLNPDTVDDWYQKVFNLLLTIQQTPKEVIQALPAFDSAHIQMELNYLQEWLFDQALKVSLTETEKQQLKNLFEQLIEVCQIQPQILIHRDFHSRNIMIQPAGELGIIDYQDAMIGPLVYDFVSLVKDCYIRWPRHKVDSWVRDYYLNLRQHHYIEGTSFETFQCWIDWTGLQRHLKVLGIFLRLKLRDNKQHYFKDTPRVMAYALEVLAHYPQFDAVHHLFQQKVMPPLLSLWRQEGIEQAA